VLQNGKCKKTVNINLTLFELDKLVNVFEHMLKSEELHSVKEQLDLQRHTLQLPLNSKGKNKGIFDSIYKRVWHKEYRNVAGQKTQESRMNLQSEDSIAWISVYTAEAEFVPGIKWQSSRHYSKELAEKEAIEEMMGLAQLN